MVVAHPLAPLPRCHWREPGGASVAHQNIACLTMPKAGARVSSPKRLLRRLENA
jgi:hypothetical protein